MIQHPVYLPGAFDVAENAGRLGAVLTAQDAQLTVLKPMRPFAAGELCAMRLLKAPSEAAATAAERRATDDSPLGLLQYLTYLRSAVSFRAKSEVDKIF